MPLLGKEEFCLKSLPDKLSPDEQVFYCHITGEAFLSYDEYFERQFLYSSLLWTCSVTGRTGLTYSEALKSEQESKALLSTIPTVLQKVMLHLMTYMNNFSTNVTLSILIEYTNLRYFIGEHVQISPKNKNKRINGIIRDVIPPENYEKSSSIAYGIDPLAYNYLVECVDQPDELDGDECIVIPAARISRSKFLLTREKIRLFLKQHLAPKNGRYEALSIKEESLQKFGVDQLTWEDIFKGPTPNFSDDTLIVKALSRQRHTEDSHNNDSLNENDENHENENLIQVSKKKSSLLSLQKQKLIRRGAKLGNANNNSSKKSKKDNKLKRQSLKNKSGKVNRKKRTNSDATDSNATQESKSSKQKDDDKDLKNRERECRKQYEEDLKNWTEKRDDLLCDDLLPLPQVTPIDCDIPSELIGDALVIIDFLNVFHEFLAFKENTFPSHLTFDYFIKILQDNDVNARAGFADLIMAILRTIFQSNMKDAHDGNEDLKITDNNNEDFDIFNADNDEESTALQVNCFANHFVTTYFSTMEQLVRLQMDSFTVTEILRIYILKTRNFDGKRTIKICADDMALVMRLAAQTIFELNKNDRIKILKILLDDVVVQVAEIRQKIEASMDEMVKLKIRIRHLNASYTRWLRENPIRQRMRKKKSSNNDQTEPEGELTKEEREQYKKDKTEKEKKMKDDIAELKAEIRRLSSFCRSRPLGMDRQYRKYWIFESIPGLFVEQPVHDEYDPNTCFDDPVPVAKPMLNDYLVKAKRRKKKLSPIEEAETDQVVEQSIHRCSGNRSTCKIHGSTATTQLWSFYTKEQFDNLLDSLNGRGFRESELKNALIIEKQSILDNHLAEFDPFIFNNNYIPPPVIEMIESEMSDDMNPVRKSERLQIYDRAVLNNKKRTTRSEFRLEYSDQTPVEVFDVNFQNQLIIFEENIFNGCFCSFSVSDRDAWYHGLNRTYCQDKISSLQMLTDKVATLARSIRPFCLMPPLSVYPESTMSSPSEKENIDNNQTLKFRVPMLSEKWLDVLKVPDSSDPTEFESSYGITNHSQLFLNLYIFERSLNWEMSAIKTANKCGICRRKANDEMILCDFCNRGYHIYCLTPPLSSVNEIEGDWYCPKCLPRSLSGHESSNNKKTAQTAKVEVEEMDQKPQISNEKINQQTVNETLLERCKSCRKHIFDSFSEVLCKTCGEYFHLRCVNLVRVPRSWNCAVCTEKDRYDEQYNNNSHNDNDNNELRRSQRKRKPNHYHEFEPNDDHYHHQSTTNNHLKSRRCSDGQNSEYHRIIVK